MKKILLSAFAAVCLSSVATADPLILPMKERAAIIDQWLNDRVRTILPELMRRANIDMWVR